jgi:hypothetical protein
MVFASFTLLVVLASHTVRAQPVTEGVPVRSQPFWSTTHAPGTIDRVHIDLARGEVEVVRKPGAVRIDTWKRASGRREAALRIRQTQTGRVLRVFDVYPPPRGVSRECHPPHAERGAFWDSDSAVKVVVFAPEGVTVGAFIMAGGERR